MNAHLKIEFVDPSRPGRVAWTICAALAVACVAAMALFVWQRQQMAALQRDAAALTLRRVSAANEAAKKTLAGPGPGPAPAPAPYDADARIMLREMMSPTAAALTALENVAMAGVTPVSVELLGDAGTAQVQVEFDSQDGLLDYLTALNSGNNLPRWAIIQAHNGNQNAKGVAILRSHW